MNRKQTLGLLAAAAFAWLVSPAGAATVTVDSSNFSLGYGFTGVWGTSETSVANTPTTDGSFTFAPTLSGYGFSASGITFSNRVTADGAFDTSRSADAIPFLASIAASYDLTLPIYATNPQLTLNITSLSIYGIQYTGYGQNTMRFTETTAGHGSASNDAGLNNALDDHFDVEDPELAPSPFRTAANWNKLTWNPADFAVPGFSSTRTFDLSPTTYGVAVDGFEIFGTVSLSYEVPEPASAALLSGGAIALLAKRRKK